MKKSIVILVVLMVLSVFVNVFALSANSNDPYTDANPKKLDLSKYHNSGNIWLRTSNYGFLGSGADVVPAHPSLEYPAGSGVNYLYQGAVWIGGKVYRRNVNGVKLYWLVYPPTADEQDVVAEDSPDWNDSMHPVVDTLTTVGFDGDMGVNELLPAYNPLESGNSAVQDLYEQFNPVDGVLRSILSTPGHRPFLIPDPLQNYCFTEPIGTGNEPGFETLTSFYYDYSPFDYPGQRDWGRDRISNNHIPLKLAVEQKSYAFPLQNYDRMIVIQYRIINTSEVDSIYDINLGSYMDNDCGTSGTEDVCGYCMGEGYEFGYARDLDGDGGLTPGYAASKIMAPGMNLNRADWTWVVGDGPDDFNPLTIPTNPAIHANEKYCLQTGINPRTNQFTRLRGGPSGTVNDYEQTSGGDIRYLSGLYGNLPTTANPNPAGRLCLPPMGSITFYVGIFAGDNLADLKEQAVRLENLVESGFDLGNMDGLVSYPYITNFRQDAAGSISMDWVSYTLPNHYDIMYKQDTSTEWQTISVNSDANHSSILNLTNGQLYNFKLVSVFNSGANEIRRQTETINYTINDSNGSEDPVHNDMIMLQSYPNPFTSKIEMKYSLRIPSQLVISIYNLKGQKVKTILDGIIDNGTHNLQWDGKDTNGKQIASGVYYIRMDNGIDSKVNKVLYIK